MRYWPISAQQQDPRHLAIKKLADFIMEVPEMYWRADHAGMVDSPARAGALYQLRRTAEDRVTEFADALVPPNVSKPEIRRIPDGKPRKVGHWNHDIRRQGRA